jgi:hypothetical protein
MQVGGLEQGRRNPTAVTRFELSGARRRGASEGTAVNLISQNPLRGDTGPTAAERDHNKNEGQPRWPVLR